MKRGAENDRQVFDRQQRIYAHGLNSDRVQSHKREI